ncbi:MAG: AI-2E family transporter [Candidatus Obscuribacterales bacterium]|nr:AI-2E family transporter [Candidatus Obscuribacterales bacterium]
MADLSELQKQKNLAFQLVLYSLIAAGLLTAAYELKALLVCVVFALTIAAAISPVAEAAESKKIPRIVTILAIYLAVIVLYVLLAFSIAPELHHQAHKLFHRFPEYLEKLSGWYEKAMNLAGSRGEFRISASDARELSVKLLRQTMGMTAGLLGLLANTIFVLFLAAYFVVEAKSIWSSILKWLPAKAAARFAPLIVPLEARLGGYVRGQILVSFFVSAFLIVGFSIIRLDDALILGILAGLLNMVPYVGSMIATALAIVVSFNQDPVMVLAVLAVYGIEQWLESSFMVPHLLGKEVDLHPLIVMFSIIAGASLMGIAGALMSVPLASVAILLAEEFYLKPMHQSAETLPEEGDSKPA